MSTLQSIGVFKTFNKYLYYDPLGAVWSKSRRLVSDTLGNDCESSSRTLVILSHPSGTYGLYPYHRKTEPFSDLPESSSVISNSVSPCFDEESAPSNVEYLRQGRTC